MADQPASDGTEASEKAPDAFRTISEVAKDLDLPQHVLRFWETRFNQIKPLKRGGGRRYYRPQDVELLRGIRTLLYGEGYTIRGVQRILREQGPRFVVAAAQGVVETTIVAEPPGGEGDDEGAAMMARRIVGARGSHAPRAPEPPPAEEIVDEPPQEQQSVGAALPADEIRRLESTLSDLLEMKRLLDQAR